MTPCPAGTRRSTYMHVVYYMHYKRMYILRVVATVNI